MNENSLPFMTYVFVGVTSLALALVTVLDKSGAQADNKSPVSSTSMLPNMFSRSSSGPSPSQSLSTNNIAPTSMFGEPKIGGKKRKTKSRRSKRNNRTSR